MRSVTIFAATFFLLCGLASPAQAKIMDTTQSRGAGQLSLGGEFQATDGAGATINLNEEIGLRSGIDLVLDQQFGVTDSAADIVLGAGVKWTLLTNTRSSPGLALWATGIFNLDSDDAGFRGHFMVDNTWGKFTPYLALDLDIIFDGDADAAFSLIGGSRIGLVRNVSAFVEGGLGITDAATEFLSAGIRVNL